MGAKSDFTFNEYEEMHQHYLIMKAEEKLNQEKKQIDIKINKKDRKQQKKSNIGSCYIL